MFLPPRYEATFIQIHLLLLLLLILYLSIILLSTPTKTSQAWIWTKLLLYFKPVILLASSLSFILVTSALLHFHFVPGAPTAIQLQIWHGQIPMEINDLSLLFLCLVSFLFPAVLILADLDFNPYAYKYFVLLICVYLITSLLILVADILLFYIFYELLVLLVFFTMFLSTNSRGCVEASMFFLGWAVLGSIFVGAAILYTVNICGTSSMRYIRNTTMTNDEVFLLFILTFFGFGTKLSLWPFWYWLPRAHVEVSTSMSVFLSCLLIKICLYGLMRFWWMLDSEIWITPFIFLVICCAFDITARLIIQVDLKSVIAHGSVLHVNLLVLLLLLDTNHLTLGTSLYIWGHSLSTAGLFFATSLIERCFSSRTTFEVSGLYNANPLVGIFAIFAVIGFLDFPLTFFFWGELWLWLSLFSVVPSVTWTLMFVSTVVYLIVFFRIWWSVLFGASSILAKHPVTTLTWNDLFLTLYLIFSQFIFGFQPNLFCTFVTS